MKKFRVALTILLAVSLLFVAACSDPKPTPTEPSASVAVTETVKETVKETESAPVVIDKLKVAYVPSMDVELILDTTEPLKQLLIDELANHNFDVKEVVITVGTSFEAVGEAISAGSADIGFGSAAIYITYDDEVDLLLTATRLDFDRQGTDPMTWNGSIATRDAERQTTGYPGLIYAGPSEYGQMLAAKVAKGETLTWEELDGARWAVASPTSNAGYLYPALWLKNNYGKMITDLTTVIPGTAYPQMFAQAANETIDVFVCYADGRGSYVEQWSKEFGRENAIEEDVQVIGVTDWIANDVVIGSETSDVMLLPGFRQAFCDAMIAIAKTPAGSEAISIFSHVGYFPGKDSAYDPMRAVQDIIKAID